MSRSGKEIISGMKVLLDKMECASPAKDDTKQPERPQDLAAWMVKTMMADGVLETSERDVMVKYAQQHGIDIGKIKRMVKAEGAYAMAAPIPSSIDEGRKWINQMVNMARADGELSRPELVAIGNLALAVGIPRPELRDMLHQKDDAIENLTSAVTSRRKKRRYR